MKINRINYLLLLLAATTLLGCKKDFLEANPSDRLSEKAVWNSPQLIEAALNYNYNDISDGFYTRDGIADDAFMLSTLSDETISDYGNYFGNSTFINGSLTADNINDNRMGRLSWRNIFHYIDKANVFLSNISNATVLDETTRKQYEGEMKTLRAFRYFTLLRRYGGVPLMDKPFALGFDFNTVKRATIDETIAFILKDLDEAIPVLPETSERLTQGTAMGLKSRLLLYAASPLYSPTNDPAKWKAAADAAKAVIDAGTYMLEPDLESLRKIFYTPVTTSKEIMFAEEHSNITHNISIYTGWELDIVTAAGPSGVRGFSYFAPTQQTVDQFEMINGKPITDPSSGYDPQNPYKNRDPRFATFIYHHGAKLNNRVMDYSTDGLDRRLIDGFYVTPTGYNMRKFINEAYISADGTEKTKYVDQSQIMPWIHMRYAEMLLNYAEAINEAEGPPNAYAYVNMIRARAGMPNLPAGLSQSEMRERIRNERRIELLFEEHRYYDVRRWKIAEQTDNITVRGMKITKVGGKDVYEVVDASTFDEPIQRVFVAPKHYFWPIPSSELLAAPGLTQNPGY